MILELSDDERYILRSLLFQLSQRDQDISPPGGHHGGRIVTASAIRALAEKIPPADKSGWTAEQLTAFEDFARQREEDLKDIGKHGLRLSALQPGWLCPNCGAAHGPNVATCPAPPKGPGRRLRLLRQVNSDLPFPPFLTADARVYEPDEVSVNQHGAVSVKTPKGLLGVKPGEFEWI